MPRKTRLDAPGTLHHVIIRGIERRQYYGRLRDSGSGHAKLLIYRHYHSRKRRFKPDIAFFDPQIAFLRNIDTDYDENACQTKLTYRKSQK